MFVLAAQCIYLLAFPSEKLNQNKKMKREFMRLFISCSVILAELFIIMTNVYVGYRYLCVQYVPIYTVAVFVNILFIVHFYIKIKTLSQKNKTLRSPGSVQDRSPNNILWDIDRYVALFGLSLITLICGVLSALIY